MRCRSYDWLFRQSRLRGSTAVFTDFDRLRHFELVAVGHVARQLRQAGMRVLNDPARSCQRQELLYRLHEAGINRFRAYSASMDPKPSRFPVFLKCTTDHALPLKELIDDQASLDKRLSQLRHSAFPLQYMLVIEFANDEHREGVYRRYTIYRVGDRMVPANPVTEASPFVKYGDEGLATEDDLAASVSEIMENPHADLMARVFEIANIDYGRADFGFDAGAPAVYEINTNPNIGIGVAGAHGKFADAVQHSMRSIAAAIDWLDGDDITVPLEYPKGTFVRHRFLRIRQLRQP